MKYLYLFICLFVTFFSNANDVKITKTPTWVNTPHLLSDTITSKGVGYQYLMIDYQENIPLQSAYYHNMVSVFNSKGIQEISDLNISYDPAYETLKIHKLQVIRDGEVIDKTGHLKIQVIQQESRQNQGLYDESLSAIIHFDDVQKNDIIEYAYTITGYNPVYRNNFSKTLTLQYNVPVNHFYYRILSAEELTYNLLDSASVPEIKKGASGYEYIWDQSSLDVVSYDVQVPYWYNIQKRVDVSTYESWKEIVEIAAPLYAYNKKEIPFIVESILQKTDLEDTVLAFINFVQDDIRYLGLEAGLNAYKPHKPKFVFDQKYGDCKDKSLLLVALLREIGLEAYPVLVSSWKSETILNDLPNINAFNHCVVTFTKNGKEYYIDPTISNQGGDINHIYFPDYRYGLVLSQESHSLISLPRPEIYKTLVYEDYDIKYYGESSYLQIKTEYSGDKADEMRVSFDGNSQDNIERNFLDYYSKVYPNISIDKPIEIIDEDQNTTNKFIVKEYYKIDSVWIDNPDYPGALTMELYSLAMSNLIQYTNSANRKQPYAIGTPTHYKEIKRFILPEDWPMEASDKTIVGPGFEYNFNAFGMGNQVTLEYSYQTFLDWISAEQVKPFLQKHDEIYENITYQISYLKDENNGNISWWLIVMYIALIAISIFFARKLYLNYNPVPHKNISVLKIGGWLVLPLIGLIITPLSVLYQIASEDLMNASLWTNAGLFTEQQFAFYALLFIENVYNIGLIVFAIVLVILFFQKRTSVPSLMIIYYIIITVFPVLDVIACDYLIDSGDVFDTMGGRDIIRSLAIMFIWIPYFLKSVRVKNTFGKVLVNGKLVCTGELYKEDENKIDL